MGDAVAEDEDLDEILQALEVNDKKELDDDMYDLDTDVSEKTEDLSPTENGKQFANGISPEPTTDATADETDDSEFNTKKDKKKKSKEDDDDEDAKEDGGEEEGSTMKTAAQKKAA